MEKLVQIMHIGPVDREPVTLRILQEFIEAKGCKQQEYTTRST